MHEGYDETKYRGLQIDVNLHEKLIRGKQEVEILSEDGGI